MSRRSPPLAHTRTKLINTCNSSTTLPRLAPRSPRPSRPWSPRESGPFPVTSRVSWPAPNAARSLLILLSSSRRVRSTFSIQKNCCPPADFSASPSALVNRTSVSRALGHRPKDAFVLIHFSTKQVPSKLHPTRSVIQGVQQVAKYLEGCRFHPLVRSDPSPSSCLGSLPACSQFHSHNSEVLTKLT